MTIGFFIFAVLSIASLCGAIYYLQWMLNNNAEFSENPKSQRRWEIGVKVAIVVFCIGLAYLVIQIAVILLAPLFEQMNIAFNAAVSKLFDFLDNIIPYAVLGGIGWALWKKKHSQQTAAPVSVTEVEIELARQKALDMQGYALGLMLRVLIAISSFTPVIRPRNSHDIEVRSTDGASFYMKDNVVIYQAEVEVEGEITPEVEDTIQREAQRYAQKYIVDYSMLISPEAGGRAPVEVLSVKNCGSRVLIDYVFTSAKSFDLIDARRRARVERQMRQERPAPYTDPDYGE